MLNSEKLDDTNVLMIYNNNRVRFVMESFYINDELKLALSILGKPYMIAQKEDSTDSEYIVSRQDPVIVNIEGENVDINSENGVTIVNRISLFKKDIVIEATVHTNSQLIGNDVLDKVFIEKKSPLKDADMYYVTLAITGIKYVTTDPILFAKLLNHGIVQEIEEGAIEEYNLMPRFRVLEFDKEAGKTKVITYMA